MGVSGLSSVDFVFGFGFELNNITLFVMSECYVCLQGENSRGKLKELLNPTMYLIVFLSMRTIFRMLVR